MSEATKQSNTQTLVDKLSSLKKEAFSVLDQSLSFDSNESNSNPQKCDQSIIMYEKCLSLIDKSLGFYEQNKPILVKNDNAVSMHSHLVSIRNQTLERLNKLKTDRMKISNQNINLNLNSEFLAVGDEILNTDDDYLIIDDISDQLGEDKNSDNKLNNFAKAEEILRVDSGVQLFYIANDGTVSTPSYPTSLSIYSFNDQETDKKMGGFIRVGDWMYPLIPNESPGMKTNFNAYIFPNNDEENQNDAKFAFVGITFSENVNNGQKQFFEDVLSNFSSLIFQDSNSESGVKRPLVTPDTKSPSEAVTSASKSQKPIGEKNASEKTSEIKTNDDKDNEENIPKSWSAERIAQNLINGAQYLSNGVSTTTEYATKYLRTGGDKLKNNLQPTAEPVSVDSKIKKAAQNVRYGTHVTVRVSSFLVNKLSSIANSTAKTVAPHLKNGSAAILSGVTSKSNANNYVQNVCTVASGSIQSLGIVYDSLEGAAKSLSKNVADQTVTVIDHK